MANLVLLVEMGSRSERFVLSGERLVVGSEQDCHLVLPFAWVRPRHVEFWHRAGLWSVRPAQRGAEFLLNGRAIVGEFDGGGHEPAQPTGLLLTDARNEKIAAQANMELQPSQSNLSQWREVSIGDVLVVPSPAGKPVSLTLEHSATGGLAGWNDAHIPADHALGAQRALGTATTSAGVSEVLRRTKVDGGVTPEGVREGGLWGGLLLWLTTAVVTSTVMLLVFGLLLSGPDSPVSENEASPVAVGRVSQEVPSVASSVDMGAENSKASPKFEQTPPISPSGASNVTADSPGVTMAESAPEPAPAKQSDVITPPSAAVEKPEVKPSDELADISNKRQQYLQKIATLLDEGPEDAKSEGESNKAVLSAALAGAKAAYPTVFSGTDVESLLPEAGKTEGVNEQQASVSQISQGHNRVVIRGDSAAVLLRVRMSYQRGHMLERQWAGLLENKSGQWVLTWGELLPMAWTQGGGF